MLPIPPFAIDEPFRSADAALRAREPSFCDRRKLNVQLFSWNVDGTDPLQLNLGTPSNQSLLADFLASQKEPDVIHFGFQEVGGSQRALYLRVAHSYWQLIDLSNKTLAARRSKQFFFRRKTLQRNGTVQGPSSLRPRCTT